MGEFKYVQIEKFHICLMPLILGIVLVLLSSCSGDLEINLGSGYFVSSEGGNYFTINKEKAESRGVSDIVILGTISQYCYDDAFILVLREITSDSQKWYKSSDLWDAQLGEQFQLWIIVKHNDEVHGPLNLTEYMNLQRELNIPDKL